MRRTKPADGHAEETEEQPDAAATLGADEAATDTTDTEGSDGGPDALEGDEDGDDEGDEDDGDAALVDFDELNAAIGDQVEARVGPAVEKVEKALAGIPDLVRTVITNALPGVFEGAIQKALGAESPFGQEILKAVQTRNDEIARTVAAENGTRPAAQALEKSFAGGDGDAALETAFAKAVDVARKAAKGGTIIPGWSADLGFAISQGYAIPVEAKRALIESAAKKDA